MNKRNLASIKSLAQVRKYLKPNFQVNIAEKQIVGGRRASNPILQGVNLEEHSEPS